MCWISYQRKKERKFFFVSPLPKKQPNHSHKDSNRMTLYIRDAIVLNIICLKNDKISKLGQICSNSFEFWFFEFHIPNSKVEASQIWHVRPNSIEFDQNLVKFNQIWSLFGQLLVKYNTVIVFAPNKMPFLV